MVITLILPPDVFIVTLQMAIPFTQLNVLFIVTLRMMPHASAGHREIIWDGKHRADCDSSIPWCMADIKKMADKSLEGRIFKKRSKMTVPSEIEILRIKFICLNHKTET